MRFTLSVFTYGTPLRPLFLSFLFWLAHYVIFLKILSGGNISTSSLFVGQYANFSSGNLITDYLSSFATNQINFIKYAFLCFYVFLCFFIFVFIFVFILYFSATATITDLEVGTLSITSSNLILTPSHSLVSLSITDSTVTFVTPDDSSDYDTDAEPASNITFTNGKC